MKSNIMVLFTILPKLDVKFCHTVVSMLKNISNETWVWLYREVLFTKSYSALSHTELYKFHVTMSSKLLNKWKQSHVKF